MDGPAADTMHHIDQANVRLLVFLSPVYALNLLLVLIRDNYFLMCVALKLSYVTFVTEWCLSGYNCNHKAIGLHWFP